MRILFDIKEMKPACAMLQAALGGDYYLCHHFPSELWLVYPTENMRLYEINPTELELLKDRVATHHRIPKISAAAVSTEEGGL